MEEDKILPDVKRNFDIGNLELSIGIANKKLYLGIDDYYDMQFFHTNLTEKELEFLIMNLKELLEFYKLSKD